LDWNIKSNTWVRITKEGERKRWKRKGEIVEKDHKGERKNDIDIDR
jgi:hypothetical protein